MELCGRNNGPDRSAAVPVEVVLAHDAIGASGEQAQAAVKSSAAPSNLRPRSSAKAKARRFGGSAVLAAREAFVPGLESPCDEMFWMVPERSRENSYHGTSQSRLPVEKGELTVVKSLA